MTTFRASQKTVAFCALVLLSASSLLAGCAQDDRPISEIPFYKEEQSGASSQSGEAGSTDTIMSGHYEVSPEGKLLRPKSIHEITPPELPEVAKAYDQNGVEAFATYFVEVIDYTWMSGDTSLLRSISAESCTWCTYIADETDKRAAAGGWVEHVNNRVLSIEPAYEAPLHPGLWDTVLHLQADEHNIYNGTTLKSYSGQLARFRVQMRQFDGQWKITGAKGEEE